MFDFVGLYWENLGQPFTVVAKKIQLSLLTL
jgi:hypothetical protein